MYKYPLSESIPEKIKTKTGKALNDITLENVLKGEITSEDIKVSEETLLMQGEIAEKEGKPQLKENFTRASELINVPDEVILNIYNLLRPNRATKAELIEVSKELKEKYKASSCSKLVLEALEIYEKRGILKG